MKLRRSIEILGVHPKKKNRIGPFSSRIRTGTGPRGVRPQVKTVMGEAPAKRSRRKK